MDLTQRGILTLMKSAVMQQPFSLPEGFSLEEAYPVIRKHHIVPMAFDGAVLCGIPRTHPVMGKLFQGYCRSLQISEGQLAMLAKLENAFQQNGIDYLPLK